MKKAYMNNIKKNHNNIANNNNVVNNNNQNKQDKLETKIKFL